MAWGVFYGDLPLLLSPPQHGHRPGSSPRFPLMWLSIFPALSVLLPPPVMLCFLVSQAVSAPSNFTDWFLDLPSSLRSTHPSLFPGLTSRAKVFVPSPHSSVSVFGDCASSSDDLFGSHSAFQNSDFLLHSSLYLEIPPIGLIFPSSR